MSKPNSAEVVSDLARLEDALASGDLDTARSEFYCLRGYLSAGFVAMEKCNNKFDTEEYDEAVEVSIGVLTKLRYSPHDRDTAGEPMEDAVQSLLMEAMLRAPALVDVLAEVTK